MEITDEDFKGYFNVTIEKARQRAYQLELLKTIV